MLKLLRRLWLRIGGRTRGRLERELEDEIRFHLERETEHLVAGGVPPAEARRRAQLRFGGVEQTKEELRGVHGLLRWADLSMDLRLAVRGFRSRPGLSLAVVVTLALGIGSSVAVFGVVRSVLNGPLPYRAADELVFVWGHSDAQSGRLRVSGPDVARIAAGVTELERVAFVARVSEAAASLRGEAALPVRRALVTRGWFRTVGIAPVLGRDFTSSPSGNGGVEWLVSDRLYRTHLAGSGVVPGAELELNGRAGVVVGVLPENARLVLPPELGIRGDVDVWEALQTPLAELQRTDRLIDQDSDATGIVVARVRPGESLSGVQASLDALAATLRRDVPEYGESGFGLEARPLRADVVARARPILRTALAAVLLVLALSVANATGLLLTRALGRSREMAVRTALGAGRARLARQVIVEHGVLVVSGALLGVTSALLVLRVLVGVVGVDLHVDGALASFALVATAGSLAFTTLAVLTDPLLRRLQATLSVRGSGSSSRGVRRLRDALVMLQVAISLCLLAAASVMTRTAIELARQDPGFRTERSLAFRVGIAFPDRYRGPAERAALVRRLEAAVATLPGVEAVGIVGGLPLSGTAFTQPWARIDDPPSAWGTRRANYRVTTAGWFDAMGIRLLAGRMFVADDDRQDRRVALIDERLAARLGDDRNVVGRTIRVPIDGALEETRIVGIVENVRYESLDEPGRETIYIPYRHEASLHIAFVVRMNSEIRDVAQRIREAFAAVDPGIPMHDVRTLEEIVSAAQRPARSVTAALGAFGVLALLLSLIALHGAVAYAVARRTPELALRLALGASPARILGEVMRTGLIPCAGGLVLGGALIVLGSFSLRALVYGVSPLDPLALSAAILTLTAGCGAACLLAARHALRIMPADALADG